MMLMPRGEFLPQLDGSSKLKQKMKSDQAIKFSLTKIEKDRVMHVSQRNDKLCRFVVEYANFALVLSRAGLHISFQKMFLII